MSEVDQLLDAAEQQSKVNFEAKLKAACGDAAKTRDSETCGNVQTSTTKNYGPSGHIGIGKSVGLSSGGNFPIRTADKIEIDAMHQAEDSQRRYRAASILRAHPEFEDLIWLIRSGLV